MYYIGQYLSELKYCSIQSWPRGVFSSLPMVPTTRNLTIPPTPEATSWHIQVIAPHGIRWWVFTYPYPVNPGPLGPISPWSPLNHPTANPMDNPWQKYISCSAKRQFKPRVMGTTMQYILQRVCNTLRPPKLSQFCKRHFDFIFFHDNYCTVIISSLKCVPEGPIKNKQASVRIMAWHRTGNKPIYESMVA